jgi:pyruvate/2-oxoglutarate dehydrogenase complex dihydrolipoamide dehydrogenase (E3) component
MANSQAAPALRTPDEHDRRLLATVHPPEWRNPEPKGRYHLVVIGAGTGGLVTAAIAAGLGAKVALVERHLMGGDCLNTGCVPSKAVIRAARAWCVARRAAERFGGPAATGPGDFAAAMERMRRVRAELSPADGAERFRGLGVDVFFGDARFVSREVVEVRGARLRFRRAVIATGARPAAPPVPGLEGVGYLTSESVFSLRELPARLAVVGGGPVGCELAQSFARFGSRVVLLDAADRILGRDDPAAARVVLTALERDGVEVLTGARLGAVERRDGGAVLRFEWAGAREEREVDAILVAAGRAPNVEGLGLEAAGVEHGPEGVRVDERLRTTNHAVFAVGDVASSYRFTHVADAQARLVVRNALFAGRGSADDLVIPWCTYTDPELAHVGLSSADAERRDDVETLTVPLDEVDRARIDGDGPGFLRLHLPKGSDAILGATLVGEHAGEIISQLTQAIVTGTGLEKLGDVIFPYPTRADVLRRAADQWRRRKLTPLAKAVLGAWLRVRG